MHPGRYGAQAQLHYPARASPLPERPVRCLTRCLNVVSDSCLAEAEANYCRRLANQVNTDLT